MYMRVAAFNAMILVPIHVQPLSEHPSACMRTFMRSAALVVQHAGMQPTSGGAPLCVMVFLDFVA